MHPAAVAVLPTSYVAVHGLRSPAGSSPQFAATDTNVALLYDQELQLFSENLQPAHRQPTAAIQAPQATRTACHVTSVVLCNGGPSATVHAALLAQDQLVVADVSGNTTAPTAELARFTSQCGQTWTRAAWSPTDPCILAATTQAHLSLFSIPALSPTTASQSRPPASLLLSISLEAPSGPALPQHLAWLPSGNALMTICGSAVDLLEWLPNRSSSSSSSGGGSGSNGSGSCSNSSSSSNGTGSRSGYGSVSGSSSGDASTSGSSNGVVDPSTSRYLAYTRKRPLLPLPGSLRCLVPSPAGCLLATTDAQLALQGYSAPEPPSPPPPASHLAPLPSRQSSSSASVSLQPLVTLLPPAPPPAAAPPHQQPTPPPQPLISLLPAAPSPPPADIPAPQPLISLLPAAPSPTPADTPAHIPAHTPSSSLVWLLPPADDPNQDSHALQPPSASAGTAPGPNTPAPVAPEPGLDLRGRWATSDAAGGVLGMVAASSRAGAEVPPWFILRDGAADAAPASIQALWPGDLGLSSGLGRASPVARCGAGTSSESRINGCSSSRSGSSSMGSGGQAVQLPFPSPDLVHAGGVHAVVASSKVPHPLVLILQVRASGLVPLKALRLDTSWAGAGTRLQALHLFMSAPEPQLVTMMASPKDDSQAQQGPYIFNPRPPTARAAAHHLAAFPLDLTLPPTPSSASAHTTTSRHPAAASTMPGGRISPRDSSISRGSTNSTNNSNGQVSSGQPTARLDLEAMAQELSRAGILHLPPDLLGARKGGAAAPLLAGGLGAERQDAGSVVAAVAMAGGVGERLAPGCSLSEGGERGGGKASVRAQQQQQKQQQQQAKQQGEVREFVQQVGLSTRDESQHQYGQARQQGGGGQDVASPQPDTGDSDQHAERDAQLATAVADCVRHHVGGQLDSVQGQLGQLGGQVEALGRQMAEFQGQLQQMFERGGRLDELCGRLDRVERLVRGLVDRVAGSAGDSAGKGP